MCLSLELRWWLMCEKGPVCRACRLKQGFSGNNGPGVPSFCRGSLKDPPVVLGGVWKRGASGKKHHPAPQEKAALGAQVGSLFMSVVLHRQTGQMYTLWVTSVYSHLSCVLKLQQIPFQGLLIQSVSTHSRLFSGKNNQF